MPIDKRVEFAKALDGVGDGATVFITGFGGAGFPNKLIRALRDKGPKNLTLVVNSATHRYSLTHELIANDQVRKVICTAARGHDKEPSPFETRWMAGKIELEMVPQGSFTERIRAGGRSTSPRHISMVSSMPSPSDWRRSAKSRSGKFSGKSFAPVCSVSKYSQITGES